ncbi:MAG: NAD-dependent epimerase/dehydratase family protein [bacterium]|nr:NAD-dependent epimerase/dehydratase family protein [bacterium]
MKTYLVTGGAGFIGSHLVPALLTAGHRVRVLDDFSTGKREHIPKGVQLFEADIRKLDAIRSAFEGVDGVFHMGALPRVQLSIDNPVETHDVNVTGTLNVLLAARDAKVKRVVYSASSAAYGDQATLPLHEEMKPNPKNPYGLQKYVGEEYAKIFSICYGLETVSLRYFNIYGPRLSFQGAYVSVIAVFLQQNKKGETLTIVGDGTQTRDFTFVEDVVRANMAAMESVKVGKGEVVNVGAGVNQSVNFIAEQFGGPTTHTSPRIEPHDTLADIRKAKVLLDWEPRTKFEEGLKRTREWFK